MRKLKGKSVGLAVILAMVFSLLMPFGVTATSYVYVNLGPGQTVNRITGYYGYSLGSDNKLSMTNAEDIFSATFVDDGKKYVVKRVGDYTDINALAGITLKNNDTLCVFYKVEESSESNNASGSEATSSKPKSNPKTGDFGTEMLISGLAVSSIGIAAAVVLKKKK